MSRRGGRLPWGLGKGLLAAFMSLCAGCLQLAHGIMPPDQECVRACQEVPKCCKDHVYIFIVHGMDPLDFANISGVNKYFHSLGFQNTWYGQLYHKAALNKEVRRIHQCDPEARFVLIGFSFGANMVRNIAQDVKPDGIGIDLLVYLGGNTLKDIPRDRPENVKQIVNILASGCIWNGAWMTDAVNIHVTDVWHFGSPAHPITMATVTSELTKVAERVPFTQAASLKVQPFANDGPLPRPVAPPAPGNDTWSFLQPVERLQVSFDRKPSATPESPAVATPAKSAPSLLSINLPRD